MTFTFADVPLWAAIAGSAFLLLGAGLVLLGTIGLVRLSTFYERMHAPTLGTSWGAAGMVMGSMIIFSASTGRLVVHEILIGVFVTLTTPVTLMLLGRSALFRDRSENNPNVPRAPESADNVKPPDEAEHGTASADASP